MRVEDCVWNWAARTPDAIAITDRGRNIAYGELASRAEALSHRLSRCGAGPEMLVALSAGRSAELIVGLVAILRSGAAYLPIDPGYPADRRAFLLEDSQCRIVVTERCYLDSFASHTGSIVVLDDPSADRIVAGAVPAPVEDPLAYVIYTSGSTGKPKGVEVTQRNVVRLFEQIQPWFKFDRNDVWSLFHSFAFDFSVFEIWGALLHGGRLVIVPHEVARDPIAFRALVRTEGVTVLSQTPSAFRMFMAADALVKPLGADALRYVVFGGEALDFRLLRPWFERHGDSAPQLVNMYGITETTVHVTYRVVRAKDAEDSRSLIGIPIPDLTIHLVDESMRPVPDGVEGEMLVGGAGVARGYFRRPELTAERFTLGFYHTGDLARRCADGELEYLGRKDQQVKLRGLRIEPGEIEAALRSAAGVSDAVVMLREDFGQEQALVGYLVSKRPLDVQAIKSHMLRTLPEYMCPSAFVTLDSLPLTPHGKLDRAALPAPVAALPAEETIADDSTIGRVAALYRDILRVPVSADSNFFGLGGTSLQAMILSLRIAEAFGVSLPAGSVFRHPSVADLAAVVDAASKSSEAVATVDDSTWQPLSIAQEQLWILQRMDPSSNAFICPVAYRIVGGLDVVRLRAAIDNASLRHPALRTVFGIENGRPVQRVQPSPTFHLEVVEDSLEALIAKPFDLEQSAGMAHLVRVTENEHLFVLVLHHVICDGWSLTRLMEEIAQEYAGKAVTAPRARFLDLAAAHRRKLEAGQFAASAEYWTQEFAGAPAVTEIPTEFPRPATASFRRGRLPFAISKETGERLGAAAQADRLTANSILTAALAALIHRYNHQPDLVLGVPYAGRDEAGSEHVQGLFMNMLPLRLRIAPGMTFRELMREAASRGQAGYAHSAYPFSHLLKELPLPREWNRQPLVQIVFAPQASARNAVKLPGLMLEPLDVEHGSTSYDLTLVTWPSEAGFDAELVYAADLFSEGMMRDIRDQFLRLLEAGLAEPDRALAELNFLSPADRQRLLREWSGRAQLEARAGGELESFLRRFARIVERTPHLPAICWGNETVSYRDLDAWSNRIAHALAVRGVGPETIVAICCERSPAAMAAILGTWKAGGAYLPLDPAYPAERLSWMLEDSGAAVIVTAGRPVPMECCVSRLDLNESLASYSDAPLATLPALDSLAYLIYTSGSTGKPKGVMVEHGGVAALMAALLETYPLPDGARVLQYVSLSFDVSVAEILFAFARGVTMVIPKSGQMLAGVELLDFLESERISQALLPASVLAQLEPRPLPHLIRLVSGGERCPAALADRWGAGREFFNAYGPTEASVGATAHRCVPGEGDPPIGTAFPGWTLYVLDAAQRLVPPGSPGELYIGGLGLARGYFGRPELTGERFLESAGGIQERLYRTGDLVRWRRDGALEFLSRVDDQQKVRGFRVELGEIEAALRTHAGVQAAAAIVVGEGATARIVGFIVPVAESSSLPDQVLKNLRSTLPAQLVPSDVIAVEELPLTPNGKVDRAALINLLHSAPVAAVEGDSTVASIWRELLGRDVPRSANFFDAGGTSLLLVEVQIRLETQTGKRIPLAELFAHPTIESISSLIGPSKEVAAYTPPVKPVDDRIAIVGMAARFPKSPDLQAFWRNLTGGVDCVTRFTVDELIEAGVPLSLARDPKYVRARGIIADDDKFDAALFEIGAHEAECIDPQQRIWLECALTALEDAGCDPRTFPGAIGVFTGVGAPHYLLQWPNFAEGDFGIGLGAEKDFAATRASYKLGLRGPSLTVQTACSTSLVAVSLACQQLLAGECDAAIAGASSLSIPSRAGYLYQEGMIFSPDGRCRPFDSRAQGTVPADGVGAVVLKRLADAVANGDDIYAVIAGTAVNNDGSGKVGYTAPSSTGQKQVVARALERAGVTARDITFVEAHGTATPMGDPIEFAALRQVYEEGGATRGGCALGSVKSNMGHLNSAAGIAGLIKAALALKHRAIPGTLHFEKPNPEIDLDDSPFYVNRELLEWKSEGPRMAAVSSFGIGGTNAHVVLAEAPAAAPAASGSIEILPLSAATPTALAAMAARLADHLETSTASLSQIARTLQTGRMTRRARRAILASTVAEAIERLRGVEPFYSSDEAALAAVAEMWCAGEAIDWNGLRNRDGVTLTHLPTYPFERQRYWGLADGAPVEQAPEADWIYVPTWTDAPAIAASADVPERWIVFADKGGKADALAAALGPHTTVIRAGAQPQSRAEVASLLEATQATGLVHCLGLDVSTSLDGLDEALAHSYYSVVALLQAAASSGISGVQVNVLTSGVQANPLAAMIPGLMRVAAREYPAIGCRAIDLAGGDFPVAAIANELRASFETPVVALRERRRLERTYQQAQPSADQAPVLRKNGVYLITGGLGGVGLALAEHLATEYGARLVLSSRNGLPTTAHDEETRQRMKILERVRQAAGGLLIQTADIGDPEQARELVQSTIREFGRLDGVIHAAGVMGGGALQRRPDEAAQAILHAKVRGTLALEAALEGVPHDFLFLCSSLSAVGSTYGQGDYTAANAFLDAYAEHANTKQRRVISVNWDGWADVGSHARYVAEKPVAHPLLNEWEAETRGGAYRTDLHPDHWIVAEHRVAGERMVPGTTYVELACAIAKTRGWEFPITIPELTLASPCTSQALYTSIQETAQGMTLRMESRNQRGEWQLHALARVEPGSTAQQETDSQMAATAVGQTHAVQPAERRGLIEFGPRWACPSWKSGSTGAYKLPEAYAAEAADFVLHPALFDMLSGVAKPEEDGAYLPFSYTDIVVHGPLGADVLVKATSSSRSQDALHVGMRITDPSGRILVTIGDYMLRLMQVAVGSAN